jgi:hypothetical protein
VRKRALRKKKKGLIACMRVTKGTDGKEKERKREREKERERNTSTVVVHWFKRWRCDSKNDRLCSFFSQSFKCDSA